MYDISKEQVNNTFDHPNMDKHDLARPLMIHASSINHSAENPNAMVVLCAVLKRKSDGRLKKFVFTNNPADGMVNDLFRHQKTNPFVLAIRLGYHWVQVQHSHADEGQLVQFLYQRRRVYEPVPSAIGLNNI